MGWQDPCSHFQKERPQRRLERGKRDGATQRKPPREAVGAGPAPSSAHGSWAAGLGLGLSGDSSRLHFKDKRVTVSNPLSLRSDPRRSANSTRSGCGRGTTPSTASATVTVIKGGWRCRDLHGFGLSFSCADDVQFVVCIFSPCREGRKWEIVHKIKKNKNAHFSPWVCICCFPYFQKYIVYEVLLHGKNWNGEDSHGVHLSPNAGGPVGQSRGQDLEGTHSLKVGTHSSVGKQGPLSGNCLVHFCK